MSLIDREGWLCRQPLPIQSGPKMQFTGKLQGICAVSEFEEQFLPPIPAPYQQLAEKFPTWLNREFAIVQQGRFRKEQGLGGA